MIYFFDRRIGVLKWSQILCSLVGFTKKNLNSFSNDILQHSLPFKCGLSFLKVFLVSSPAVTDIQCLHKF